MPGTIFLIIAGSVPILLIGKLNPSFQEQDSENQSLGSILVCDCNKITKYACIAFVEKNPDTQIKCLYNLCHSHFVLEVDILKSYQRISYGIISSHIVLLQYTFKA